MAALTKRLVPWLETGLIANELLSGKRTLASCPYSFKKANNFSVAFVWLANSIPA